MYRHYSSRGLEITVRTIFLIKKKQNGKYLICHYFSIYLIYFLKNAWCWNGVGHGWEDDECSAEHLNVAKWCVGHTLHFALHLNMRKWRCSVREIKLDWILAQEANVSDAFRAEKLNYGGGYAGWAWEDDVDVMWWQRDVFFSKHRCRTKVAKAYLDVSGSRPLNFSWDLQTFAQRLEKKQKKTTLLYWISMSLFKSSAVHNCFYAFF